MATIEEVRRAARQLPAIKQIQLIQDLLRELQQDLPQPDDQGPPSVHSTPITTLNDLAADFWSAHELVEERPTFYVPRRERERLIERAVGSSQ